MRKNDIIARVSAALDVDKRTVAAVLDTFFTEVVKAAAAGEKMLLSDLRSPKKIGRSAAKLTQSASGELLKKGAQLPGKLKTAAAHTADVSVVVPTRVIKAVADKPARVAKDLTGKAHAVASKPVSVVKALRTAAVKGAPKAPVVVADGPAVKKAAVRKPRAAKASVPPVVDTDVNAT